MSKSIEAVFGNGIFRPLKKVRLPEHKKFKIILENEAKPVTRKPCSLAGIIDIAKNCPDTDLSTRHDKYLYGEIAE
ncbi:MAG: antitoxin family protein [Proteobacteria bacterium]|nr:antitoxin family protein [Pseudomonadota bacterium]